MKTETELMQIVTALLVEQASSNADKEAHNLERRKDELYAHIIEEIGLERFYHLACDVADLLADDADRIRSIIGLTISRDHEHILDLCAGVSEMEKLIARKLLAEKGYSEKQIDKMVYSHKRGSE